MAHRHVKAPADSVHHKFLRIPSSHGTSPADLLRRVSFEGVSAFFYQTGLRTDHDTDHAIYRTLSPRVARACHIADRTLRHRVSVL